MNPLRRSEGRRCLSPMRQLDTKASSQQCRCDLLKKDVISAFSLRRRRDGDSTHQMRNEESFFQGLEDSPLAFQFTMHVILLLFFKELKVKREKIRVVFMRK